jgi:hypothetical protein
LPETVKEKVLNTGFNMVSESTDLEHPYLFDLETGEGNNSRAYGEKGAGDQTKKGNARRWSSESPKP